MIFQVTSSDEEEEEEEISLGVEDMPLGLPDARVGPSAAGASSATRAWFGSVSSSSREVLANEADDEVR